LLLEAAVTAIVTVAWILMVTEMAMGSEAVTVSAMAIVEVMAKALALALVLVMGSVFGLELLSKSAPAMVQGKVLLMVDG